MSCELREWATRILSAESLEDKLHSPLKFTDNNPGPAVFWKEPTRPPGMGFHKRGRSDKLPSFQEHGSADKRAICLHRFAGHELLAVEIMAYALLAFPEAPRHFRMGVANTLREEQGHVRLYMKRMKEMGLSFGDLPQYKHFWIHTPYLKDPINYVSVMNLTLEQANLDFAPMYRKSFLHHGDTESAALMEQILHDEIAHVSFGWNWLKKLKKPEESEWDAWTRSQGPFLSPKRAKGFVLHPDPRVEAGIPTDWNERLVNL